MWKWCASIISAVIAGIIVYYVTEIFFEAVPNPPIVDDSSIVDDSPIENHNSLEANLKVNWTNVPKYFHVKKPSFFKGYGQADSAYRFLLQAKGTFSGILEGFIYDQDNVKLCTLSYSPYTCLSHDVIVMFENSDDYVFKYSGVDPRFRAWSEGEAQWASTILPYNTAKLELHFNQRY